MLGSDRVHHGLIFHGPPGVGKGTTATVLAEALLCLDRASGSASACGRCRSCDLFRESGHPDFRWVAKELAMYGDDAAARKRKLLSIPVDVVRKHLIEPAYKTAQLGGRKVFVVDEAELLNAAGQNAMLKTLEEPPEGTVIILVTSSEDRLLPTIRSRCQRIGFGPLPDDAVAGWLDGAIAAMDEPPEMTDAMRAWVVGFADGSLGRAQLTLDFRLTDWAAAIRPRLQRAASGQGVGDLGAAMTECIQGFAEAWVKAQPQASKDAANKRGAALMCGLLTVEARRRTRRGLDGESVGVAGVPGWLAVIDAVEAFNARLNSNVNMAIAAAGLGASVAAALSGTSGRPDAAAVPLIYDRRLEG